jgi:hypothetical protein
VDESYTIPVYASAEIFSPLLIHYLISLENSDRLMSPFIEGKMRFGEFTSLRLFNSSRSLGKMHILTQEPDKPSASCQQGWVHPRL